MLPREQQLREAFSRLRAMTPPAGFTSACDSIDADIYEFEGYIAGLVSSYLAGHMIDPSSMDMGDDVERRLLECEEKLSQLKTYAGMINQLARMLVDAVHRP